MRSLTIFWRRQILPGSNIINHCYRKFEIKFKTIMTRSRLNSNLVNCNDIHLICHHQGWFRIQTYIFILKHISCHCHTLKRHVAWVVWVVCIPDICHQFHKSWKIVGNAFPPRQDWTWMVTHKGWEALALFGFYLENYLLPGMRRLCSTKCSKAFKKIFQMGASIGVSSNCNTFDENTAKSPLFFQGTNLSRSFLRWTLGSKCATWCSGASKISYNKI